MLSFFLLCHTNVSWAPIVNECPLHFLALRTTNTQKLTAAATCTSRSPVYSFRVDSEIEGHRAVDGSAMRARSSNPCHSLCSTLCGPLGHPAPKTAPTRDDSGLPKRRGSSAHALYENMPPPPPPSDSRPNPPCFCFLQYHTKNVGFVASGGGVEHLTHTCGALMRTNERRIPTAFGGRACCWQHRLGKLPCVPPTLSSFLSMYIHTGGLANM